MVIVITAFLLAVLLALGLLARVAYLLLSCRGYRAGVDPGAHRTVRTFITRF